MLRFHDFDDLEDYVRGVLSEKSDLDRSTPMMTNVIRRKGRPCAVEFTMLAPRSIRLSAIWEAGAHRILFYDQNLERFQVTPIAGLSIESLPREREATAVGCLWRGK